MPTISTKIDQKKRKHDAKKSPTLSQGPSIKLDVYSIYLLHPKKLLYNTKIKNKLLPEEVVPVEPLKTTKRHKSSNCTEVIYGKFKDLGNPELISRSQRAKPDYLPKAASRAIFG
jgi:hypothetical protein